MPDPMRALAKLFPSRMTLIGDYSKQSPSALFPNKKVGQAAAVFSQVEGGSKAILMYGYRHKMHQ